MYGVFNPTVVFQYDLVCKIRASVGTTNKQNNIKALVLVLPLANLKEHSGVLKSSNSELRETIK